MKIAILSDIHGNYDAFNAVIKSSLKFNINKFFILGDIMGYFYDSNKILSYILKLDCEIIKGNHDAMFLKSLENNKYKKYLIDKFGNSYNQDIVKISKSNINYLKSLKSKKSIEIDNAKILICHGSPKRIDQYIYPDCKKKILRYFFSQYNENIILAGHTHRRMHYNYKNNHFINFGSVGQFREKGGLASWGIIDTITLEFKNVLTCYKRKNLIKQIKEYDPKKEDFLIKSLYR